MSPPVPVHRWFLRRREAWLPTVWGWLLMFFILAVTSLLLGRFANRWLSVDQPAHGVDGGHASTLVVEGWMGPHDLDAAIETFRRGGYRQILTTGGPTDEWPDGDAFPTYADRAADYLRHHGVPADRVFAVPAPASAQDRTFLSAVMVRDWAAGTGTRLAALDLFSVGAHTRRSLMVYRMAFGPAVEVGAIAARPYSFDADRWWSSSAGVKSVMGEVLSIAWTACCFWPPQVGSHEERWAAPDPRRAAIVPKSASASGSAPPAGRPGHNPDNLSHDAER